MQQTCVVSEEAEFLSAISEEFSPLYSVVSQAQVLDQLEIDDDRYRAVLSARAGCANSGQLCQQTLAYLEHRFSERFTYADCTNVEYVTVTDDGVALETGTGRQVTGRRVVLCTNGFIDHTVQDGQGRELRLADDQVIMGQVAHMAAFSEEQPRSPGAFSYIRNTTIGDDAAPYAYVTRRTYDRADDTVTLTCMGDRVSPPRRRIRSGSAIPRQPPANHGHRSATTGATAPPCWTALRLPLARTDGLQRRRNPRDRSAPASPATAVQPRLQRRRVPAVDPRRAAHLPTPRWAPSQPQHLRPTLGSNPQIQPSPRWDRPRRGASRNVHPNYGHVLPKAPVFSTTLSSMSAIFATPSNSRSMSASGGLRSHHVGR